MSWAGELPTLFPRCAPRQNCEGPRLGASWAELGCAEPGRAEPGRSEKGQCERPSWLSGWAFLLAGLALGLALALGVLLALALALAGATPTPSIQTSCQCALSHTLLYELYFCLCLDALPCACKECGRLFYAEGGAAQRLPSAHLGRLCNLHADATGSSARKVLTSSRGAP